MTDIYKQLSQERKSMQEQGTCPDFMTTAGWSLMKQKYLDVGERTPRDAYHRVIARAVTHLPSEMRQEMYDIWMSYIWKGWLALSTPVLANMGTTRGCPVSCSGNYVEDSVDGFYKSIHETAMLSKYGFGTSSYLGHVRPRGSNYGTNGKANGLLPVIQDHVLSIRNISQGSTRRGAWAGYIPVMHDDFYEIVQYLFDNPDDLNIGWIITDEFIDLLEAGDEDANQRFQKMLYTKAVTGKGYFFFVDKVNRASESDLPILASNLCTEIMECSSPEYTFTCVLSSVNAALRDEWILEEDFIKNCVLFLDCVAQEFIELSKSMPGLEKARKYTEDYRSLGLGVLGFHTYLQQRGIAMEDLEAMWVNQEIFQHLHKEAFAASEYWGKLLGVPEKCRHLNRRNMHLLAIAPNTSSSILCGGVSEGITPVIANAYNQPMAGGEVARLSPVFLKLAKERGHYNKETIDSVLDKKGSVQHFDWLTAKEKLMLKTAFEIPQDVLLRLASQRQPFIDQGQSLNLHFAANEDEAYIAEIHKIAFLDENIKSLYYMRTQAGVLASKDCVACEG